MAVTRITRELIDVGLIEEGVRTVRPDLSGRRPTELAIKKSGAYVLGLGIYAYEQSAVLMDLAGQVLRQCALEPPPGRQNAECLIDWTRQIRRELIRKDFDPLRVLGAGVAVAGNVDTEQGILLEAPYLGWSRVDIAGLLKTQLNLPVVVSGTASALLSAARRTFDGNLDNALLFNVGFAIGGAFLIDGRVARGDQLRAGQIGHLPSTRGDRLCSCGQKGCLNALASGWAALADLGEVDGRTNSAEEFRASRTKLMRLLRREAQGEPNACKALRRAGQHLGRAASQLFVALDTARVFLSGPVGLTSSFFAGVKDGFAPYDAAILERCDCKFDAAAALLALEQFVFSPRLDFDRLRQASALEEAA